MKRVRWFLTGYTDIEHSNGTHDSIVYFFGTSNCTNSHVDKLLSRTFALYVCVSVYIKLYDFNSQHL